MQAAGLPVHVALDWPSGSPAATPARVHIQAVRTVGEPSGAVPVEAEAAPEGVVLDLGEGVWQLQASAPGYWSQETEVTAGREASASVRLALWPAASLHGEISVTEGEPPHALEVQLSAASTSAGEVPSSQAPFAQAGQSPSYAELRCPIDRATWSCQGPAGLFDVRLEAAGFTPRYVWGVSLKAAASADLGRTELRQTASVFGRAVRKDGSYPPGPCRAILQADVDRRGGPEPDADRAPEGEAPFSVPLSRSGYFQVVGVLSGRHMLSIECPAASGFRELIVQASGETRIDPPVQLEELTLDVTVTPKADPEGKPWELTVDATAPRLRRIADKATTTADGRWIRRGLMAGNYRIAVGSSDGASWLQRNIDLGTSTGPLSLRLASVRVAGRVLLSMQPVRARLDFVSDTGEQSATLASDERGRFQGLLPVEFGAQESNWTVDAHVAQPPVSRRMTGVSVPQVAPGATASLELALPTIAVRGSVVSEEGQPQRGAQVTFDDSSGARTATSTDDAGSFEMPDLPPGKYSVVAESDDGVSERVPLEVAEGIESKLKLVLISFKRVTFNVVANQEPVTDAAVQVWIPPGTPLTFTHTDRDGRFVVKLPPGTTLLGLTVGGPEYVLKLTRMPIPAPDAPPDAHTITLDTSSGTLVLNLEPPDRTLDSSATLYVVHNGAIQDARTIAGWGTDQPGTSGDGPAEVDAIEPGDYALCVLADPSELTALWQGALPQDRCSTGTLQQNQTLTLTPK